MDSEPRTPTSGKPARSSGSPATGFTPVASPARSPNKGNLTGIPRKVKDSCADWYNYIQKWNSLMVTGAGLVTQIGNMKLEVILAEQNEENSKTKLNFPEGLDKLCDKLSENVSSLTKIVDKFELITQSLEGIAKLEKQQNQGQCFSEPLFETWTIEEFIKASKEICVMYQRELAWKKRVAENIAHTDSRDVILVMTSSWVNEPYVEKQALVLVEAMICETSLR